MLKTNLQETIERLVNQEILACQSSLVEAMLQNGMAEYEEIENMYIDNSDKIQEVEEERDEILDKYNELEDKEELTESEEIEFNNLEDKISDLENQIEELEREQEEPQDIFEWWLVSNWLANKLRNYNEPILDNDYGTWWGRTCTGQSISMDYVMECIAEEIN